MAHRNQHSSDEFGDGPTTQTRERSASPGTVVSLRTYLLGLIVALLIPALAFAGLLIWVFHDSGVKQYERDALELSRRLTAVIDREVASVERSLQVLATSRLITERRYEDLHKQALEIKAIVGSEILIKDANGQQLVNTRLPWGAALPISLPDADRVALERKVPTVSDVFIGATAKRPIVSVNVPILRDGQVIGLINTGIDLYHLSQILQEQGVAETWTAAIVDRAGKIVARSRQAEVYVGTTATEDLRKNAVGAEGLWVGWTADGIPVVAAYARSEITGWVTAVGVPKDIVEAPLWRSVILLGIGSVLALLISVIIAHLLSRPLTRWTQALTNAAAALGRGEPFVSPPVRVAELSSLSDVLSKASSDLRSLQSGLESQVADRTKELVQTHEKLVAEVKQRESIEEQLRHSQKMEAIGQLTGGLAHDFNNLLTIIGGSLQILQRRMDRGETGSLQRYVDSATEGVVKASALTHRLLAFGRQQPLSPKALDANGLVKGMSDLLRRSLGEAISIETVLSGGLWRTHVDGNQLENAILNLTLNARDAMPEGGNLTIETANVDLDERYAADNPGAPTGQFVMIAITDTGIGMPAAVLNRAFDPFFTTKATGQGTGLGLSQVYGFVRQSGGHIKIYSEENIGTTVKIYLPRFYGEADRDQEDRPEPRSADQSHERRTILVVEDDDSIRKLSIEFLTELGYRTIEADTGAAALRILDSQEDIDLLFTDVVMPGMNGRRLADEARQRKPNLKVLFTTGYTRNAVVHGGIIDPDVSLVSKPFTIEQLASKVSQVLARKL
jgi:signal transduction histidine kinase/CheY-like chemotaxis protein